MHLGWCVACFIVFFVAAIFWPWFSIDSGCVYVQSPDGWIAFRLWPPT
jgi:hypothetical protein